MKKILVIPSSIFGVGYFRSTTPHEFLQKQYPDEFDVTILDHENLPNLDKDYLKNYDMVHFHKKIATLEITKNVLETCRSLGVKTVLDADDHWRLPNEHPSYHLYENRGIKDMVEGIIKIADCITTTTPYFKNDIQTYNSSASIYIIPNAIDASLEQYKPDAPNVNPKQIRFGWLGSSTHINDLNLLKNSITKLFTGNYKNQFQMVMCGFDDRMSKRYLSRDYTYRTGFDIIAAEKNVWVGYELIFTNRYDMPRKYVRKLQKYTKESTPDGINERYRRIWATTADEYAHGYRQMDVSLAPLADNLFNRVKSNLKVQEAGFHKKALIAQNIAPYQIDGVHGKNMLLATNVDDWYRHFSYLIKNPNKIEDLAEQLYEDVQIYEICNVTRLRRDVYNEILSK